MFSPSQLNGIDFFLQSKILEKFEFFHRLNRLFVIQIPRVTVYQESVEHTRFTSFYWLCETDTSRNKGGLFESSKIDTAKNCI